MSGRAWVAGIVSGIVYFIWLSIIHMATPLGFVGFSGVSNEEAMRAALKANVPANGLYYVPFMDMHAPDSKAEMARATELIKTGPTALMVVHPNGQEPMMPRQLIGEAVSDIVQGILVVFLIVRLGAVSFGGAGRMALVAGLIAAISTNFSYWNWYGFPGSYTLVYMLTAFSGYLVMGCTGYLILRKKS